MSRSLSNYNKSGSLQQKALGNTCQSFYTSTNNFYDNLQKMRSTNLLKSSLPSNFADKYKNHIKNKSGYNTISYNTLPYSRNYDVFAHKPPSTTKITTYHHSRNPSQMRYVENFSKSKNCSNLNNTHKKYIIYPNNLNNTSYFNSSSDYGLNRAQSVTKIKNIPQGIKQTQQVIYQGKTKTVTYKIVPQRILKPDQLIPFYLLHKNEPRATISYFR